MKNMMMTEDRAEAKKVEALFIEIFDSTTYSVEENSFDATKASCYCKETDSFNDNGGMSIPRGSLVYVYRDIGGGEAVYDIYSFGYGDRYLVSKDNEGDIAGLVNAGSEFFPF